MLSDLNLRRNPFGEPPDEDRLRLAVLTLPDDHLERVRRGGFALLLVGPRGRGKTTHLRAIAARLPGAPVVRVPIDGPPPRVPTAPVVLVDELHLLPDRVRLLARRPGLVATTHGDHAAELAAAGLPWAAYDVGRRLDRARLREVVARRIAWARRGDGPVPWVSDEELDGLLARRGDDLRAILDDLYEATQRLRAVAEVVTARQDLPARYR